MYASAAADAREKVGGDGGGAIREALGSDVGLGGGTGEGQVRDDAAQTGLLAESCAQQRSVAAGDVDQSSRGGELVAG